MYGLIDIHVNKHEESGLWMVSSTAHIKKSPGDDSPIDCGVHQSFNNEHRAFEAAKEMALAVFNERLALQAAVFVNGDEVLFLEWSE